MQSTAKTVEQYLAELPAERREAIEVVRALFKKNLDNRFGEGMQYGMIGYFVPHSIFPAGYHCDPKIPLPFAGIASQKQYMAVYLMCLYSGKDVEARFRAAWKKTGKKLDMGKCCIRFKKLDELALDVLADTLSRVSLDEYIQRYQALAGKNRRRKKPAGKRSKPAALAGRKRIKKR